MDIIYEVPQTFRVSHIREVSRFPGDTQVFQRATPFVLIYRAKDAEKAENMELTDELFELFLTIDPAMAKNVNNHILDRFHMSESMLEQLLKAPKSLLEYVKKPVAKTGSKKII